MLRLDGRLVYAASDLNDFLDCDHRVALNRLAAARGERPPADDATLEIIARKGIAFIPWYPLQVGKLAATKGPLANAANKHKATPSQIALAWLLRRSPVMLPIPGTSKVKHLEENVAGAGIELTDEEYKEIPG